MLPTSYILTSNLISQIGADSFTGIQTTVNPWSDVYTVARRSERSVMPIQFCEAEYLKLEINHKDYQGGAQSV